ncbi:MAG: 30S ribosomal protein S16 [Phycisphaerae bacterium]|nr:30S ribosomal protein S16 [Phycisphaerae bacterium]
MAVKLRMSRVGRRHRPFFRINAVESLTPRDGRILERLGHYDPIEKDKSKQLVLQKERVLDWLAKGAVPSDSVAEILSRNGIKTPQLADRRTRRAKALALARKKGLPFTKAEKEAAKAAEEAKKAAEGKKEEKSS